MKGESIPEEVVPHFMKTFEVLVKLNLSPEVMRSLSLFLTYAFHLPPASASRTPRPGSALSRPDTPSLLRRSTADLSGTSTPTPGVKFLSKKEFGTRVLDMYSNILCEKGNLNPIKKFAKTVTNKVQYPKPQSWLELTVWNSGSSIFSPRITLKSLFMGAKS